MVVKATSEASASGLIREVRIDPREYPIVQWRWKVSNILRKGNELRKDGDDYPARLYIAFQYDADRLGFLQKAKYELIRLLYGEYPPLAAVNYIWANQVPRASMLPNAYTDRVMMVAVESGADLLDQWVTEERNIYEDYKKLFGEEPPMISGVAIMTDTDNTGESAMAFYGDILFKSSTDVRERPDG